MKINIHAQSVFHWLSLTWALAPCAGSAQVARSTFDADLDGWTPSNTTDIYWRPNSGGGYLRFSDITTNPQYMTAPASYLGDWRPLRNGQGALTFEHAFLAISSGTYNPYGAYISGPGGSASWQSDFTSSHSGWWTVRIPIDPSKWQLLSGNWETLLANVTYLRLPADQHSTNGSTDEEAYDNFRLGYSGSGHAYLDGYLASVVGELLEVEVWQNGNLVETLDGNYGPNGTFGFSPSTTGPAVLKFRFRTGLWKAVPVTLGPTPIENLTVNMTNGDCDHDNEVGIGDYALLSAIYGLSIGDPGYDTNADLNGDTTVDIADYAILSANYGEVGE